ncbi:MAG: hypothetical protein M3300_10270 [Actinomycetota bacterium]|nr:hypothetical protein [Actinomycetota bacterium]
MEQPEVLWGDLPGYRIRHDYVVGLRGQRVTIVNLDPTRGDLERTAGPRLWTRTERAHRRLSWAARLVRNRCPAGPPCYRVTVCGVLPALAAFLVLAPGQPG